MRIVLASASPRRAELLRQAGVDFSVFAATSDESAITADSGVALACARARHKAEEVYLKTGGIVLGADTVVIKDGRLLEKPADKAQAYDMFRLLCGGVHEVVTAVCIVSEDKFLQRCEKTSVAFGAFDLSIVDAYVRSGKPFDKAGGYGIQDSELAPLIKRVDGDRDTVIGLPVRAVLKLLKENF